MSVTIQLDIKELERVMANTHKGAVQVLEGLGFKVEADAKMMAPYRTGALMNSIYTKTRNGSSPVTMGDGEDIPNPEGDVVAVVGPTVSYARFLETGTSRMAARPYLLPALESVVARFNKSELFDGIMGR